MAIVYPPVPQVLTAGTPFTLMVTPPRPSPMAYLPVPVWSLKTTPVRKGPAPGELAESIV